MGKEPESLRTIQLSNKATSGAKEYSEKIFIRLILQKGAVSNSKKYRRTFDYLYMHTIKQSIARCARITADGANLLDLDLSIKVILTLLVATNNRKAKCKYERQKLCPSDRKIDKN